MRWPGRTERAAPVGRRGLRRAPARPRSDAAALDPFAVPTHHFPQLWLLCASFALLGLAVLTERDLLQPVFALDRSRVTALIAALVLAGSAHALWHLTRCSRRIEAARRAMNEPLGTPRARSSEEPLEKGEPERASVEDGHEIEDGEADEERAGSADEAFVRAWIRDTATTRTGIDEPLGEAVLERYADRLRSPVDLGWFLVDVTIRLGLLGTIIGFILIFTSLSGVSVDGAEGLRELLVAMSGGMGTALFTTLAGLVGATLLSVQYLILGRAAEHLLGLLARCRATGGRQG